MATKLLIIKPGDYVPEEVLQLETDGLIMLFKDNPADFLLSIIENKIGKSEIREIPVTEEIVPIDTMIEALVRKAYEKYRNNKKVSEILGVSERTIYRYRVQFNIK